MSKPEQLLFTGVEEYLRKTSPTSTRMFSHQNERPNESLLLAQLHFVVLEHLVAVKNRPYSMDSAVELAEKLGKVVPSFEGMTFVQALEAGQFSIQQLLAMLDVFKQCVIVATLDRSESMGVSHTVDRAAQGDPRRTVVLSTPGPKNDDWLRAQVADTSGGTERDWFNVWTGQDPATGVQPQKAPESRQMIIHQPVGGKARVEEVIDPLMDERAWAELHRLRAESTDRDGIRWYDHAVAERLARRKNQEELEKVRKELEELKKAKGEPAP